MQFPKIASLALSASILVSSLVSSISFAGMPSVTVNLSTESEAGSLIYNAFVAAHPEFAHRGGSVSYYANRVQCMAVTNYATSSADCYFSANGRKFSGPAARAVIANIIGAELRAGGTPQGSLQFGAVSVTLDQISCGNSGPAGLTGCQLVGHTVPTSGSMPMRQMR